MTRSSNGLLTVIIASVCDDDRAGSLRRACESVRAMAGNCDYSILVVANGPRVSSSVFEFLSATPGVRVVRLRTGSQALARRVGAELADSEFIAFLDDDDELIPDTLADKVAYFREHPDVDVLVTDGLRVNGSMVTKIFPSAATNDADLVERMMHAAWGAGALTLRSQRIDLSVLNPEIRHMEWTLTALELALRYKVGFLDEPTYRYYETTADSLSKNPAHRLAAPVVWRRLSRTYAGTRYQRIVRHRHGSLCHSASWECVHQGKLRQAWRLHFESLGSPGGMAYVIYSLRLAVATLQRLLTRRDVIARN